MSVSETQPIPRPRPAAKLRRSTNGTNSANSNDLKDSQSPPPPYAPENVDSILPLHKRNLSLCSVSSNVDPSLTLTAQMLGLDLENSGDREADKEMDEQYIREKSREELEKLLLKAESVIRTRERELQLAAAAGQKLLESNLSLRQRHASLVTKTSPFRTPAGPADSQTNDSLPLSPLAPPSPSFLHPQTPVMSQRHSRRLSTSPAQLAVLSSQNEDLIQALGKLQDETSSANLEGKQRLRKLEKEIAGLRAELEHAHVKNGELEHRIDTVQNDQERQAELKKQEREAKVQELRASTSKQGDATPTFANFAPTSQSPRKPNFGNADGTQEVSVTRPPLLPFPSSEEQMTLASLASPQPSQPSAELIVLGQLLSKIEELESTNREILQRHRETDDKLRNASNQSNALQKVYENLEDEIDTYADDEAGTFSADQSPNVDGPSHLVPFRGSLKGRGLGSLYPPPNQRVRTLRERGSPVPSIRSRGSGGSSELDGTRQPVMGLLYGGTNQGEGEYDSYDGGVESDHGRSPVLRGDSADMEQTSKPALLKARHSKRRLRPKVSSDPHSLSSSKSTPNLAAFPKAPRSTSSHHEPLPKASTPPNRSLDQPRLWEELSKDMEELVEKVSREDLVLNFEQAEEDLDVEEHTIRPDHSTVMEASRRLREENRAVAAIRAALDPRNAGQPLQNDEHILPVGSLEGAPGESFFLLQTAVQSRPNQWIVTSTSRQGLIGSRVERMRHMALPPSMSLTQDVTEDPWETRYPEESETDVDAPTRSVRTIQQLERRTGLRTAGPKVDSSLAAYQSDASLRRTAALSRLNNTAAARAAGPVRRRRIPRFNEDEETFNEMDERREDGGGGGEGWEVQRRARGGEVDGWGKTLLEIWIILQAAIILLVFVYSMARRGPRAILDAAEVNRRRPQRIQH